MNQAPLESPQTLLSEAQSAERAQQFPQALSAYERLVRLAPDNHQVWHLFGLCSLSAGLLPNAVEQVTGDVVSA